MVGEVRGELVAGGEAEEVRDGAEVRGNMAKVIIKSLLNK